MVEAGQAAAEGQAKSYGNGLYRYQQHGPGEISGETRGAEQRLEENRGLAHAIG